MAAVPIQSDFGAQERKNLVTVSIVSPSVFPVKIQVLFPLGMGITEEKWGLRGKVLTIDKIK